jgi:hypothetical protein
MGRGGIKPRRGLSVFKSLHLENSIMSKRIRFVLLLLVIAIAGLLLYPTVNWYFMVPEDVLSGTPTDPGRQRN